MLSSFCEKSKALAIIAKISMMIIMKNPSSKRIVTIVDKIDVMVEITEPIALNTPLLKSNTFVSILIGFARKVLLREFKTFSFICLVKSNRFARTLFFMENGLMRSA